MNKYEKNKPVKTYEQTTLDDAIKYATPNKSDLFEVVKACDDCHAGTNALGEPLDCRTCDSTGRA
jgi:hypothetical protein